ncbi:cell envelope integrity protein TolA [Cardiobacterium hominis]
MSSTPWFGGGKPRPPGYDKYKDIGNGTGGGFKSIYEGSNPYVNPETGSDNFKWFGGERRKKTQEEIDRETQAKKNALAINRQKEYQNWEIGEARKQQEEELAAWQAENERIQLEYAKQRKEMARVMEEQRIAAQNQMAAAKAKGNKAARPEASAYEGEPSERRGGGDDGGASGTLLTRAADKPTLGKRGRLGARTLLGG